MHKIGNTKTCRNDIHATHARKCSSYQHTVLPNGRNPPNRLLVLMEVEHRVFPLVFQIVAAGRQRDSLLSHETGKQTPHIPWIEGASKARWFSKTNTNKLKKQQETRWTRGLSMSTHDMMYPTQRKRKSERFRTY